MTRYVPSATSALALILVLSGCNSESTDSDTIQWQSQNVQVSGAAQDIVSINMSDLVQGQFPNGMTITGVSEPSHGVTQLDANQVTYNADDSYFGSDSFSVTISDGEKSDAVEVQATVGQKIQFTGQVTHGDFEGGTVTLVASRHDAFGNASTHIDEHGHYQLSTVIYGEDLNEVPALYAQSAIRPNLTLSSRLPDLRSVFDIHFTHNEINRNVEHAVQITPLSTAHDVLLRHAHDGDTFTARSVRKATQALDSQLWMEMGGVAAILTSTPQDITDLGLSNLHDLLSEESAYNNVLEDVSQGGEQSLLATTIEQLTIDSSVTPVIASADFIGEYFQEQYSADFEPSPTFTHVNFTSSTASFRQGPFDDTNYRGRFPKQNYSYTLEGDTINLVPVDSEATLTHTFTASPSAYLQDPQVRANFVDRFGNTQHQVAVHRSFHEVRIISTYGDYYLMRPVIETVYEQFTLTDQYGEFVVPETTILSTANQKWINRDEITTEGTAFTDMADSEWILYDPTGFFAAGTRFQLNSDNTVTLGRDSVFHPAGAANLIQNSDWSATWSLVNEGQTLEVILWDSDELEVNRVAYTWLDSTKGYWSALIEYSNPEGEEYAKIGQIARLSEPEIQGSDIVEAMDDDNMLVSGINSRPWQYIDNIPQNNFPWFGFRLFDDNTGEIPGIVCNGEGTIDYCPEGIVDTGSPDEFIRWTTPDDALVVNRSAYYQEFYPNFCSSEDICSLRAMIFLTELENGLYVVIESNVWSDLMHFGEENADYDFAFQIQPRINYYSIQPMPALSGSGHLTAASQGHHPYQLALPRTLRTSLSMESK